MVENQEVKHITVNGKYRVVFERSAVKGQDGFKVEANGDTLQDTKGDAFDLYCYAQATAVSAPVSEPKK